MGVRYTSETSLARPLLGKYCNGNGVDLGHGGDKINPTAISVDRKKPYACTGDDPTQLVGDARELVWFRDNCLDYVYSSHLLEDFEFIDPVLAEWTRVIKPGGFLVLYLPNEQVYRAHCKSRGVEGNRAHKNAWFSAETVKAAMQTVGNFELVYETDIINEYSFGIVFQKKRG